MRKGTRRWDKCTNDAISFSRENFKAIAIECECADFRQQKEYCNKKSGGVCITFFIKTYD